jgi:hypothetical protein
MTGVAWSISGLDRRWSESGHIPYFRDSALDLAEFPPRHVHISISMFDYCPIGYSLDEAC